MAKKSVGFLKVWLPLALAISAVSGLIYWTVQQDIRLGANDPQIQIAEDTAASLEAGTPPTTSPTQVDISKSLDSFTIIYDDKGNVVTSNAVLNGKTPTLPAGIFDIARNNEDRLTWQPEDGVRIATVVTHYSGKTSGFVLSGRNMREVENRESRLFQQVVIGWVLAMAGSFILSFLLSLI